MILGLSFLFTILIVISVISMTKVIEVEKGKRYTVLHMLGLVCLMSFFQLLNLYSKSADFSSILHSLYMACYLWLFAFIARFVQIYTQVYKGLKNVINITVLTLGFLDSVIVLTNRLHNLVFNMEQVTFQGNLFYIAKSSGILCVIHDCICIALALIAIYPLGHGVFKSKSLFSQKKFVTIFAVVLISFAATIYVNLFAVPFDLGIIFFAIAVNTMCYLYYVGVPNLIKNEASQLVIKESDVGVFIYDIEHICLYVNEYGKYLEELYDINDLLKIYLDKITVSLDNHLHFSHVRIKSGGISRIFDIGCIKLTADEKLAGYVIQFSDITDAEIARNKFIYTMTHDELTGLFNSSFFYKNVKEYIEKYEADEYVMLVSDIRGFKFYNKIFGRDRGNQVLVEIAQLLMDHCTEHSVYGRIADDEFAIFMDKQYYDEDMIYSYIKSLRQNYGNSEYRVSINAGVYDVLDPTEPLETMCDKAKLAISQIKDDFSRMIIHFDPSMIEEVMEKHWIIEELDDAIKEGQICMYLQPQVDVATGKWIGAEALVRWEHPKRGLISPAVFIPVLEDHAVIYKVDLLIWEQAAAKLSEWKHKGYDAAYISVNVSGQDFYHVDLYEVFTGLVKKYNIEPASLKIEITETIMAQSLKEENDVLKRLRKAGFIIELDDFGNGYSSLNTLKDLEADVIKIDMGFLGQTENVARSKIIFSKVVDMIKDIDLDIVVEGVESVEQRDFVENTGCSCIQGYYYSKPITVKEFEKVAPK